MDRFFLYVLILGFFKPSIGQNSNWYTEEYDGFTPCQLSWSPPGSFAGFTGHDINNMSYDAIAGALVFDVKTHSTNHGPLYYTLNEGDDLDCKPGKGLVDLSGGSAYYSIRVKATEPMQIKMYLQEGNDASWDLSKVSATPLVMDLITSYQHFCVHEVDSNPLVGNVALDLSKIGTLVFELGKTDGVNFDQVDGKVFIDYIRIKAYDCGNSIKEVEQKVVNHNLYPNPSNGKFNVELLNYEKSTISLLNVNGKLIESKTSLGKKIVEFKNDLTKGLYFVQVQTKSGIQVSKLTVK